MVSSIIRAAEEYHRRCEAFDRTVCTGFIGPDGLMPANRHELALVGKHAKQMVDLLAAEIGIDRAALLSEIRRATPAKSQRVSGNSYPRADRE